MGRAEYENGGDAVPTPAGPGRWPDGSRVALVALALSVFGWPIAVLLGRVYLAEGDYSHGFVIPVVAVFLALQRRTALAAAGASSRWFGFVLLCLGIGIALLGWWYQAALRPGYMGHVFLDGFGLLLCLSGVVWVLLGRARTRILAVPLAYLLFALPLPETVLNSLTLPLRGVAVTFSTLLLRTAGVPVFREGNVLHLAQGSMGVDDACSGIRSIWVLLATAVALVDLLGMRRWRAALLLSAVPVLAVGVNLLRVCASGYLLSTGHPGWLEGAPHEGVGLLTAGLSALGLVGVAWLLHGRAVPHPRCEPAPRPAGGNLLAPWRSVVGAVAMLSAGAFALDAVARHYQSRAPAQDGLLAQRKHLADFPAQVGNFRRLKTLDFNPGELAALRPSDDLLALYESSAGERVLLSLLYWYPQRIAPGNQFGAEFGAPHNLDLCYLAAGWTRARDARMDQDDEPTWLPGHRLSLRLFEKPTASAIVLFWNDPEHTRRLQSGPWGWLPEGATLKQRLHAMAVSWNTPAAVAVGGRYSVSIAVEVAANADETRATALDFARALAPFLPAYGFGPASVAERSTVPAAQTTGTATVPSSGEDGAVEPSRHPLNTVRDQ